MRKSQAEKTGRKGNGGRLAALGLVLLPILCCGLPLLVTAGGLGLIGSVLRNPYVIGAGLLILLGLVAWAIHRQVTKPGKGFDVADDDPVERMPASGWDRIGIPLLRLLSRGDPVDPAELATETGLPIEEIRRSLAGRHDVEYDESGRIVGNGITLRPTAYRFEVDGRLLYTWCALDMLVFPTFLEKRAKVSSTCAATGAAIRVDVEPDRIVRVEPSDAVVSIVDSSDRSRVRASFCDQVHFFANAEAAGDWLEAHPGGRVVPVAEAQRLGRPIIRSLPIADDRNDCCC